MGREYRLIHRGRAMERRRDPMPCAMVAELHPRPAFTNELTFCRLFALHSLLHADFSCPDLERCRRRRRCCRRGSGLSLDSRAAPSGFCAQPGAHSGT
jgi:hypothetical protein